MKTSRIVITGTCTLVAALIGHAQSSIAQPDQARRQQPSTYPAPSSQPGSTRSDSTSPDAKSRDKEREKWQSHSSSTQSTGVQATVTTTTEVEPQVRTIIQEIDAEGPVIVERISTRFADVTCTEENARALIVALHDGSSVTLRGENGEVATFTPTLRLGYGEAYIAMSLAVEALRNAGITGCATPAQWQAVLLGGELSGGTRSTTTVSTARFPGILVLRQQEGGWAKVAQTTRVELGQVVSQAHSTLQLKSSGSSKSETTRQQSLTPTGHSSDYNPHANAPAKSGTQSTDASKSRTGDTSQQDTQKAGDNSLTPTGRSSDYNPPRAGFPSTSDQSKAQANPKKDSSGQGSTGGETEEEKKKRERGY